MAPNKLEDTIREKLQERELQPSQAAWEKLAGKLDKEVPQNRNRSFVWVAVAASFIGVLLLSTWLFQKDQVAPKMVEQNPVEVQDENPSVKNTTVIASEELPEETLQEEPIPQEEIVAKETPQIASEKPKVTPKVSGKIQEIVIPSEEKTMAQNVEKPSIKKSEEELFIDQKVGEVVVAVQELQNTKNEVTPDEIDALLAKAQRDIANNRILNSNTDKVDATALLRDVETELERSFRDKVFEALGDGFNRIRTAVIERNN